MNWIYTTQDGRLTVTEYMTGFEIVDNENDTQHWLGDGVGMFEGIFVGTPEFYQALAEDIEWNEGYYVELINN